MKGFLKKRWHRIPVALVSALLVLILLAGSAFAIYPFFQVGVQVTVEEAFILSAGAGDDLSPYMIGGDVIPLVTYTPAGETGLTVTIEAKDGVAASEFCPGEQLVIPVNVRNRSDAALTIEAAWSGGGGHIQMDYGYANNGVGDSFQYSGEWAGLNGFSQSVPGHNGKFGSTEVGADVLFIKITAANDAPAQTYYLTIDFSRS